MLEKNPRFTVSGKHMQVFTDTGWTLKASNGIMVVIPGVNGSQNFEICYRLTDSIYLALWDLCPPLGGAWNRYPISAEEAAKRVKADAPKLAEALRFYHKKVGHKKVYFKSGDEAWPAEIIRRYLRYEEFEVEARE